MNNVLFADLRRHNLHHLLVQKQVIADIVRNETVDPLKIEQERIRFLSSKGVEGEEALQDYLCKMCLEHEDLDWQIALPLRIREYCIKHYKPKAEANFLIRKNQLDKVIYSLLRVSSGLLARELYLRIKAGEANFADLAARFAEGPEKTTNGIIGPVALTQAHPALAERLRISSAGELINPFKIGKWWLVVRLERYTPAFFDEAMERQMSEELFNQMVSEETTGRLQKIYEQSGAIAQA